MLTNTKSDISSIKQEKEFMLIVYLMTLFLAMGSFVTLFVDFRFVFFFVYRVKE